MKLKPIYILALLVALALVIGAPVVVPGRDAALATEPSAPLPTEAVTVMDPTEHSTADPTEAPAEITTEPENQVYTLSFLGDCTLGCSDEYREDDNGFIKVVGEDYDYPLANVRHILKADDFTIANLEGPLTEDGPKADKQFVFRGPPAYTAILSGSSVEAVTTANNHSWDYGTPGEKSTNAALDAAGISHAGREGSFLYTTASGLTIGVYCDDFAFDRTHIRDSIAALREQGAEIVVCAFHWGEERSYTPTFDQTTWGHIAIDAGADIVCGHHPHVLQPMEYYGGGVIFYSLGNFCYGGSITPYDMDTAIIQQQVIRQPDGSVTLGETTTIACSVSSAGDINNYQPTPVEAGSAAYGRVMQKLAGTY